MYDSYIDRFTRKSKKNYKEYFTDPGYALAPVYEYAFVDGIKQLVKSGVKNVQDEIESYAESTDINVIVSRWLNGDESVLNQTVGQFGDFRNCPTTYAEMFDRVQKCKNLFDTLPVDIKEKFENSSEKFWTEFGSDYFNSVFEDYENSDIPPVDINDVKEVENAEQ